MRVRPKTTHAVLGLLAASFAVAFGATAETIETSGIEQGDCSQIVIPLTRALATETDSAPSSIASNEVEIAQYGAWENVVTYRSASFVGVRFDPPFTPPYTISRIRFPSLTVNGVAALFPSVSLIGTNSTGRIEGPPIIRLAPFEGSADGINEASIDLTVTEPGKTFYWCVEFPSASVPGFPNNYPFLRMDYRDMDRGFFANSFAVAPVTNALPRLIPDRNIIASMVCVLSSPDAVPIESSSNLGGNRIKSDTDPRGQLVFSFKRSRDFRANGTPMPKNSLQRTELLYRANPESPWSVFAAAGPRSEVIPTEPFPSGVTIWTTRAVDKSGNRAMTSSVVETVNFTPGSTTETADDAFEPNGRPQDFTPIEAGIYDGTCFPAGDQDYYRVEARAGGIIQLVAIGFSGDGANEVEPILYLYDQRGEIVAIGAPEPGLPHPRITYTVPAPSANSKTSDVRRFIVLVADIRGSLASPDTAPRVVFGFPSYVLTVAISAPPASSMNERQRARRDVEFRSTSPAQGGAWFHVSLGEARVEPLVVRIYDLHGRLVRSIEPRPSAGRTASIYWDGTDSRGRAVASGSYFAALQTGTVRRVQRVVIIR